MIHTVHLQHIKRNKSDIRVIRSHIQCVPKVTTKISGSDANLQLQICTALHIIKHAKALPYLDFCHQILYSPYNLGDFLYLQRLKSSHGPSDAGMGEGELRRLHLKGPVATGHQTHQTSTHSTTMCGVRCCKHFTNFSQSQRPSQS